MNRLFFLILTVIMATSGLNGQVVMVPQSPTQGVIPKQQMFSLLVNNLSGAEQQSVLIVQVTDLSSSQVILELVSVPFTLNTGVRRITFHDLQPFTSTNASQAIRADLSAAEFLPFGRYNICYRLMNSVAKSELLSSECIKVLSEPLVPPQLVNPSLEATLTDIRPAFTWTPPAPLNLFTDLRYEVTVSRIYANQSPEEAIRRNLPVFKYEAANPTLVYPGSFQNLQEGQEYVWQVIAKEKGRPAAESEVWPFKILSDSVKSIIENAAYVQLSRNASELTVSHEGFIKMEYYNFLNDSVVTVTVRKVNDDHAKKRQEISFEIPVQSGQNLIEYNVGNKLKLDARSVYQVTLTNSKEERWTMKISPRFY